MSKELFNILSNSNKNINNQKLMDYLNGKLPLEEKHELEKQMVDSDLVSDAVEGLSNFENKKDLKSFTDQLNENLLKQLDKKKARKEKRKLKEQPWIYLAIILILLFTVLCFVLVKKHLDNEKEIKKHIPAVTVIIKNPRKLSGIKLELNIFPGFYFFIESLIIFPFIFASFIILSPFILAPLIFEFMVSPILSILFIIVSAPLFIPPDMLVSVVEVEGAGVEFIEESLVVEVPEESDDVESVLVELSLHEDIKAAKATIAINFSFSFF